MGEASRSAPRGLLIYASFSKYPDLLARLPTILADEFGPLSLVSPPFAFTETRYYEPTMGPNLLKQLFAGEELQPADCLPSIKTQCNRIEERIAREGRYPVERPLNLDPGYLDLSKLILATTKDHAHRLYLGQGIFGEITLSYRDKDWHAQPWTYPDYNRAEVRDFLHAAREICRERLERARVVRSR